jgi:WD40 repeat protein
LEKGAFRQSIGVQGQVLALALSPDGRLVLASGTGASPIFVWDLEQGYTTGRFREHEGRWWIEVRALTISPDGRYALSGDSTGRVILWEIASLEVVRRLIGHTESVVDASFGPGGRRALTCDRSGVAILWDLESGVSLGRFTAPEAGRTEACALSPDGKLGAVAAENDIVLWHMDVPTLDEVLDWIETNRYVRDLTCHERELYRIEPLCEE